MAVPRRIWLGVLGVACTLAAGCPGGCNVPDFLSPTGVQSVAVAPTSAQLTVGQTQQFTATVQPDRLTDRGITWAVAPSAMATIDSKGMLTALAPGQVVVSATTVATPVHTAEAAVSISASPRQ